MSTDTKNVRHVDAVAAAEFLERQLGIHVSSRALLNWAKQGRCPHLRLAGRVYYSLPALLAWARAGYGGPEIPARMS